MNRTKTCCTLPRRWVGLGVLAFGFLAHGGVIAAENSGAAAFFRQHCFNCHDVRKHKGDVRLDLLSSRIDADNVEIWKDVVHNLQRGDMPPEEEKQPEASARQAFLEQATAALTRYEEERSPGDARFMRLTNTQIANSLKELLHSTIDIAPYMVEDPADKHGYALQSETEFSGGYFNLYLPKLEEMVNSAVPDLLASPDRPEQYAFRGNEWEQQHYLARRDVIKAAGKKRYKGPFWLEDDFKIPLPPKHEYRMSIFDNRPEGQFRIRIKLRNMPPTGGGDITPQELTAFLCTGILRPYGPPVATINVQAKEEAQTFDLFGNVRDWVGVGTDKIDPDNPKLFLTRTLTLQNNGKLTGYKLPGRLGKTGQSKVEPDRTGEAFMVRADDFWLPHIKDRKARNKLTRSAGIWGPFTDTPAAARKGQFKPAIYKEAIETHGWLQIESVEFELPYIESWPPTVTRNFMAGGRLDPAAMGEKLKSFARKAWRRPLTAKMEAYLEKTMATHLEASPDNPYLALRDALTTVLTDPRFLHLASYGTTTRDRNYELVSRLSYFLWDGPPDDVLFALANRDTPITDAQLRAQVDRMLGDAKVDRFVENFAALWFDFKRFDQTAIDPVYYPEWPLTMKQHFKGEAVAFFNELLKNDLSCLNVIDSDFVVVNRVLADHYGIEEVHRHGFTRVPAPEERGGVLTMGAFHLAFSDGRDAHAVNRGVWVRSRLLGDPVSEPPPDIPALADQDPETVAGKSLKQRLVAHARGTCYDCHKDVDHWGIAIENFSPIGTLRSRIRVGSKKGVPRDGQEIDSEVEIDGAKVSGTAALKKYLLAHHKDGFAYGFSKHVYSYALGRRMTYRDEKAIVAAQREFQDKGYRMRALIKAIVTSEFFKKEAPQP